MWYREVEGIQVQPGKVVIYQRDNYITSRIADPSYKFDFKEWKALLRGINVNGKPEYLMYFEHKDGRDYYYYARPEDCDRY